MSCGHTRICGYLVLAGRCHHCWGFKWIFHGFIFLFLRALEEQYSWFYVPFYLPAHRILEILAMYEGAKKDKRMLTCARILALSCLIAGHTCAHTRRCASKCWMIEPSGTYSLEQANNFLFFLISAPFLTIQRHGCDMGDIKNSISCFPHS